MLLIHFRRLTASQEEYLAKLWIHMSSGWAQSFCCSVPEHGPILSHQMSKVRKQYMVRPTGDSNRGTLAHRARTQTADLKSHMHRRPVTISICLIRFIPESTRNHAGTDETVPLLPATKHGPTLSHKMSKGRKNANYLYTV